jgi:hypothetical protein
VIAVKQMKAFAISKDDFMTKTPKDLLPYFDQISNHKCKWIEERFIEIAKNVNQLKDAYFDNLTE